MAASKEALSWCARVSSFTRVSASRAVAGAVSQGGSVLLVETVRKVGLHTAISAALAPWSKPRAVHDLGKVLLDVALGVALGGLPRRRRHAAGRTGCIRPDGIRAHSLPAHRCPRRNRPEGAHCDPVGAGRSTVAHLRTGRGERSGRRRAGDRGHRRRARPCTLRQTGRHRDLKEDLRPPSARRVRRPQPSRVRRAGGRAAAARQRRRPRSGPYADQPPSDRLHGRHFRCSTAYPACTASRRRTFLFHTVRRNLGSSRVSSRLPGDSVPLQATSAPALLSATTSAPRATISVSSEFSRTSTDQTARRFDVACG